VTQFQTDEDDPNYSSPADHYSEINEQAWTSNNDERLPSEGPYESLSVSGLEELMPAVTTADVYDPLRRDAGSDTSDGNKRVRSLPTPGRLQEDTVQ